MLFIFCPLNLPATAPAEALQRVEGFATIPSQKVTLMIKVVLIRIRIVVMSNTALRFYIF